MKIYLRNVIQVSVFDNVLMMLFIGCPRRVNLELAKLIDN